MKEIVLIVGYNAAGKSTLVQEFVSQGYHRINRDLMGGSIEDQAKAAKTAIQNGCERIVLDNTYPTKESRASIIAVGKQSRIPVRCVWLTTSFEDAQLNACLRMIQKTGRLLMPEDFKASPYKNDPNLFPPVALFNYKKHFQKPSCSEGFDVVEERPFERRWPGDYTNKAILLDYDDTLRHSTGKEPWPTDPSEVEILPGRFDKLQGCLKDGYLLLGVSNQSAIAKGLDIEVARKCFEVTNEKLACDIDYMFCPHSVPPVKCYCRKPHVGMAAHFILKYKLEPSKCIVVGDQTTDETLAKRAGMQFEWADSFFRS